jgi:hypothetical protein
MEGGMSLSVVPACQCCQMSSAACVSGCKDIDLLLSLDGIDPSYPSPPAKSCRDRLQGPIRQMAWSCGGHKSVGLIEGKSKIKQNTTITVALKTSKELMIACLMWTDRFFYLRWI